VIETQPTGFSALRRLIREDWERHDRRWSTPGFQALAVQRFGAWLHRRKPQRTSLSHQAPWLVYRVLFVLVRNFYGIELYHTTALGRRIRISHQHGISVHEHAEIGDDCHIHQFVTIGRGARGRNVGVPRIGNGVELAPGAVLIGPISIGDGARIGPNAVVMTDVPAGASVSASPARVLKLSTADSSDDRGEGRRHA
jgi:serine acetyltransferase